MLRFSVTAAEKMGRRSPVCTATSLRGRDLVRKLVQLRFQSNTAPNPEVAPSPAANRHPSPNPHPGRPVTRPSYVQQFRVGGSSPTKHPSRQSPTTTAPLRPQQQPIKPNFDRLRNIPKSASSSSSGSYAMKALQQSRVNLISTQQQPPNARQANLGDVASNDNARDSSSSFQLVDFFKQRIQEAQARKTHDNEESISSSSTRTSLGQGTSGFRAAGLQAKAANDEMSRKVETVAWGNSSEQAMRHAVLKSNSLYSNTSALNQPLASENPNLAEKDKKPTGVGFILKDLKQLKNPNSRQEGPIPPAWSTAKASEMPAWRQNIYKQQQQQQQGVDSLFATSRKAEKEDESENEDVYKNTQIHSKPKPVKDPTIFLPLHDSNLTELSSLFRVKVSTLMRELRKMGENPKDDDSYTIDVDTAEMLALELKLKVERSTRRQKWALDHNQLMQRRIVSEDSTASETTQKDSTNSYTSLSPRPAVVCIMGHVDHGKTTLMDALRRRAKGSVTSSGKKEKKASKKSKADSSDVAGTEAGGITQVISAFQVPLGCGDNEAITFLDTPGHAAFSAMRQSGSHAADIIVLVVAADDGVSKQTIEIMNFYKSIVKESAGGITMVVAMNKIDKPGIKVQEAQARIENQLLEHGIIPEGIKGEGEFGAPVQFFPISAKNGDGLDELIEGLALQSEVMDLRADETAKAEGIVMDARVEKGLGVVVDCIIRWGSMERSDVVVSGTHYGKVKILKDVNDKTVKKGLPSQPVRIIGFQAPPKAGDPIACVASEEVAQDLIERRIAMKTKQSSSDSIDPRSNFSQVIVSGRESMTQTGTEQKLEKYELNFDGNGRIRIPVIVKADADGSVAAVCESLVNLGAESTFDLFVDPIQAGVGPLTASDIEMAKESDAAVFCFGLKTQEKSIVSVAAAENVHIRQYDVIYSLIDDAKVVFTKYLPLSRFETVHGKAKVQEIFTIKGKEVEHIAGLKVTDGMLYKNEASVNGNQWTSHFRVLRKGEVVSPEGDVVKALSLRRFKDNVDNVRGGDECGLGLSGFSEFQVGDVIECYSVEMRQVFA